MIYTRMRVEELITQQAQTYGVESFIVLHIMFVAPCFPEFKEPEYQMLNFWYLLFIVVWFVRSYNWPFIRRHSLCKN